ncbi:MAG: flagellar basal-body rod protein FlgF [Parvularculaceae bacterium]|nr:flagellar basal-body rod protein FlgF [Parvularculaceae bacterium]
MSNVSYVSLSRQAALARELASIANNVANADTDGFRRDGYIFSEYVIELRGEPSLSQTRIGARMIDAAQGKAIETGGALDAAIEGPGYFAVETPRGVRLTRAGSFQLNDQGVLSTADGWSVSGEGGAAIVLPGGTGRIVISSDGVVSADGVQVAKLEIVDADPAELVREGANLFRVTGEVAPVQNPSVRQGYVEASNVNPVLEISRMIEVQRAFEIGERMLEDDAERTRRAVETLSGGR